jgi:hypothetical protein
VPTYTKQPSKWEEALSNPKKEKKEKKRRSVISKTNYSNTKKVIM